jgi:pyruvate formate lyase activating enzyme
MHEARQYTKLENNIVKCSLCNHRCTIQPGMHGICGFRWNENSILNAATYGKISVEVIDPIEKKPLFHYLPGTLSYSLGSIGCNFHCEHCQNWHISSAAYEEARFSLRRSRRKRGGPGQSRGRITSLRSGTSTCSIWKPLDGQRGS